MAEKVNVPIWQRPQNHAQVERGATVGATLGKNLFYADGSLVKIEDFQTSPAASGSGAVSWSLIASIPAPVTALAGVSGAGFFTITGSGTGALRSFANTSTITWTNPAGAAGNPSADFSGTAADVPYDNSTSGLTATDTQAAIDEVAAGGGMVPTLIPSGKTFRVRTDFQALFAKTITLAAADSTLLIEGYLVEVH